MRHLILRLPGLLVRRDKQKTIVETFVQSKRGPCDCVTFAVFYCAPIVAIKQEKIVAAICALDILV